MAIGQNSVFQMSADATNMYKKWQGGVKTTRRELMTISESGYAFTAS